MSNPFSEFFQSPTGREIVSCIERSDRSLREIAETLEKIAESLEKIANPLIANPLIANPLIANPIANPLISVEPVESETFVDPTDGLTKTRPRW